MPTYSSHHNWKYYSLSCEGTKTKRFLCVEQFHKGHFLIERRFDVIACCGEDAFNSLHMTGTFMCLCNASTLRNGHVYVPADVVNSNEVNSEAKRAFRVNPCLLSSN